MRTQQYIVSPAAAHEGLHAARLTGPLALDGIVAPWEEIPLRRIVASRPLRWTAEHRFWQRQKARGGRLAVAFAAFGCVALAAACGFLIRASSDTGTIHIAKVSLPVAASAPKLQAQLMPADASRKLDPPLVQPEPSPDASRADEPDRVVARAEASTQLVAFASAPFPYDGAVPGRGPFLDVAANGQRGHRTARGQVLWEEHTFKDSRVLVHVPPGFDPERPAVLVVFFHGHGATLTRDVIERQRVADQVSASGANAILVAPQFAVDARDSSAGQFWQAGGFSRFLDEASDHIAATYDGAVPASRFKNLPVVIVAYSGGYLPAAYGLKDVAADRVRGVVLLDALYGELDRYAGWLAETHSGFLVSAYTRSTHARNVELEGTLRERGLDTGRTLPADLSRGGATFLATAPGVTHTDYVTKAWTADPVADILRRLPEFSLDRAATTASLGHHAAPRTRSAAIGEL